MKVKQIEPVKQVRWAGLSRQMKQAGLSWATGDELNGKRKMKVCGDQLVSGSDGP